MGDVMQQYLQSLRQSEPPILCLADDGFDHPLLEQLQNFRPENSLNLLSNRFDVYQQACSLGIPAQFNDWQLANAPNANTIILRVCKERRVNHHLIHSAAQKLPNQGTLVLLGKKNEGIKTYAKFAESIFNGSTRLQKKGDVYCANFTKSGSVALPETDNYHDLRAVLQIDENDVFSKPGLYGWDKIDEGSQLLARYLLDFCNSKQLRFNRALDLGCGYGYLSLKCLALSEAWVATDTNAAALAAMAKNARHWQMKLEAKPSDCADSIAGPFDLIVCNPPFHKGFGTSEDLTELFIRRASEKLSKGGLAFFVVNSFIPIEKYANRYFELEVLENNKKFKVLKFSI